MVDANRLRVCQTRYSLTFPRLLKQPFHMLPRGSKQLSHVNPLYTSVTQSYSGASCPWKGLPLPNQHAGIDMWNAVAIILEDSCCKLGIGYCEGSGVF